MEGEWLHSSCNHSPVFPVDSSHKVLGEEGLGEGALLQKGPPPQENTKIRWSLRGAGAAKGSRFLKSRSQESPRAFSLPKGRGTSFILS